ncbi:MAG: hypothetical protein WBY47_01000 [Desulfobacterales bacterium]|jgi:hypothetical protein
MEWRISKKLTEARWIVNCDFSCKTNQVLSTRLQVETFAKRAFLPNPPEADKFLRLPREMLALLNPFLTFNRGEAYFSGVNLKFLPGYFSIPKRLPILI